jgi:HAD superfamily hydrolase (TIGR01549 family)
MASIKALFFDLFGTLADTGGGGEAIRWTCSEVAAALPGIDSDQLAKANADVWRDYWPQVEERWTLGALDGAAVSLEAWTRALRACGCKDEALARLVRDTHMRHQQAALNLYADAQELFARLRRTDFRLALIANAASDSARETLATLGIDGLFGAVVVSGELGVAKPNPAIFAVAAEALGVDLHDAWHIGDHLRTEVLGAKAAGMGAVWLNRDGRARTAGDPEPDHEIRFLTELTWLLPGSHD